MARTQATGQNISDKSVDLVDISDALSAAIFGSQSPGWTHVVSEQEIKVELGNIKFAGKFEKQSGHIRHAGFIKGNA